MKETKDMKDKITDYCLEFIKKDEVKKELKNLFKPIVNLILEEIYPYIYLSLLLVVISFFLVLGIFIMSAYNSKFSNIKSVEEIFLLLCIPGIDMFRLFITRLLNKKNPFKPDRNHFHHLLQLKFNNNWTICTYFSLTLIPLLLQYIDINIIYSIFILIAIYLYLIWYLKRI